MNQQNIRNFSIIAHIDHGKSTLADRLIEKFGSIAARDMKEQLLDSMDIERERGITIKAQTVRLLYKSQDGQTYQVNLMDTPGHVDFVYEVSRSLAACEGSVLVVDASQGVEAQTLANAQMAVLSDHEIVIALNKADLPSADAEKCKEQIREVIGLDTQSAINVSAKFGTGIDELMEMIVRTIPSPCGKQDAPLKALLVDSWYDQYLGVIVLIRVVDGSISVGTKIRMMSNNAAYVVENVGYFTPKKVSTKVLNAGEVGFIVANIKQISDCKVGDTITDDKMPCLNKLPGFKPNLPMVFCSFYPSDAAEFEKLKESLHKLKLNDASLEFEMETSSALGMGFRCGFLGLLHLEIIQERLDREFDMDIVTTAPSVIYKIHTANKQCLDIHNPADLPDISKISHMEEPWVKATILVPDEYLGSILNLCSEKRGIQLSLTHTGSRAMLHYRIPLNEIVFDFYDKLKSRSKGYASLDWQFDCYELSDLVRLNILINGDTVDALSCITHKTRSETRGRQLCEKLKELIPQQMFEIKIQAAIGGRIIARETVKALRKDVLAKCYGGDITRKRKLLDKQKEGKKRMRQVGAVNIPQSAFVAALKLDD